jgi:sphingomyelin phosphodiesterase acid-like 3
MRQSIIFLFSIVFTAASIGLGCSSRKASRSTVFTNEINTGKPYFLFLSDVHLAANRPYTDSTGEDTGTDLWDTVRRRIHSILNGPNPPAFILYTGDMPEHGGNDNPSQRDINIDTVLVNLHQMSALKNIPLFYSPGNNDALGGNYCLFSDSANKEPFSLVKGYSPYPYQAFNVSKTPVSSGAYMISDTNMPSGYYSARISKGLRIISLNTVMWSSSLSSRCPQDAAFQLKEGNKQMIWLEQQLAGAAMEGDKVYLAMHVPPGADAFSSQKNPALPVMMWGTPGDASTWQNDFLKKISAYKNTVAGVFFGHTHMDEFRLLFDPVSDTVNQVAISSPGISPLFGNHPGFKLVQFDAGTKLPTDFITYYATVQPVRWQKPYWFSQFPMVKPGASIYDQLKKTKPADRNVLLNSIYTVMNGVPKNQYDTLGLNVKRIKTNQ